MFIFNPKMEPGNYILVEGRTVAREDESPIPGVNVRTVDTENRVERKATRSRLDGKFWKVLDPTVEMFVVGSKEGYFASRADLPAPDSTWQDTIAPITLYMVKYEVGALVKTIYYDYNKSDIRKLASKDLYEIVYFLQDNPDVSVELDSYTDSRGGDAYNKSLSQRRSDAAVNYIISRNIRKGRVVAKGLGETNLLNKCKDGVECTDEEHAVNRRTEIRVTDLDEKKQIKEPLPPIKD